MVSETACILAITGGTVAALVLSKRRRALPRRLLSLVVAAGLLNLAVLAVSGFLREGDDSFATLHALTGHLMLPLIGLAVGLWLGSSFPGIRRPFRAFSRLLFLLLLCFFCLSNTWTGYLGPSRFDRRIYPENDLRFVVIHRWVMPLVIGIMLLSWLLRLAASSGVGDRNLDVKAG